MRAFRASVRLCCEPLPRLDRRSDPDLIETRDDSLWSLIDPTVIQPPTSDRRDPRWVPSDRSIDVDPGRVRCRRGEESGDGLDGCPKHPSTHPIIPLDHSREREVHTDRKGTSKNTTATESLIACAHACLEVPKFKARAETKNKHGAGEENCGTANTRIFDLRMASRRHGQAVQQKDQERENQTS